MADFSVKRMKGRISSFSQRTATGKIKIGAHTYPFEITCFRSGKSLRYPSSGQEIEAVFSEDGKRLVSVWASDKVAVGQ